MRDFLASALVSIITVLAVLAVYHLWLKPVTPKTIQGWIGI